MTNYVITMTDGRTIRIDNYVGHIDMDFLATQRWSSWTCPEGGTIYLNIAQMISIEEEEE